MRVVLLVLLSTGCAYISDKHEAWRLDPDEDGVDISSDCDDSDGSLGLPIEWFLDQDEDGYGSSEDMKKQCTKPAGYVRNSDDCDDTNPNIFPEAVELCDEQDNNCDEVIDEGVTKIYGYLDADSDGYGDPATEELVCELRSDQVENGEDCDDSTSTWQIAQPIEVFYNGIDDNCDASDLDGDQDADGFWLSDYEEVVRENGGEPMLVDPAKEGDCDDVDPSVNPIAIDEPYDGIDTNCSGNDDYDQDADGFVSDEYVGLVTVGLDETGSLPGGDCNDYLDTVHPDAIEDCSTEYDDDCDGSDSAVDAPSCVPFYKDYDGDGHGGTESRCQCSADFEYQLDTSDDCNDFDSSVYPDAFDPPHDGVDADCAGDDDYDYDDDGFVADEYAGLMTMGVDTSGMLPGGDCDDSDGAVHPEAVETCLTLVDDDCDGSNNEKMVEGCTVFYFDGDGDGYGRSTPFPVDDSADPAEDSGEPVEDSGIEDSGVAAEDSGIEDSGVAAEDTGVAAEDSGIEDSGVAAEDSGSSTEDTDDPTEDTDVPVVDDDEPLASSAPPPLTECWCFPTEEYTAEVGGDCNDSDVLVRPGAIDVPYDARDTDCGEDDDFDQDGDGYAKMGHEGEPTLRGDGLSFVEGSGELEATDCDDTDPSINPLADEMCDDVDNDCDDQVDEPDAADAILLYRDDDGDGFGQSSEFISACSAEGYSLVLGDCDDTSASVYPGAIEACDLVDADCDGDLVGEYSDMDVDGLPDCADPPLMIDVATTTMLGVDMSRTGDSLHIDVAGRLAVGAPMSSGGMARVYLVSEMAEGEVNLETEPTHLSPSFDDPETEEPDYYSTSFGMQVASVPSVTCTDTECDSTALLVAAPSISSVILIEDPEVGRSVTWPSSSGVTESWMTSAGAPALDGAGCGDAIAAGTFAFEPGVPGSAGLVVGCPDADTRTVHVLQQSTWSVGLLSEGSLITEGEGETSDGFGQVLAVGDFNGDDIDDVAVGAPTSSRLCEVGNCGAVHVFQGPHMDGTSIDMAHATITGSDRNDRLGLGLATGDMDGDGTDDLLVGTDIGWFGDTPKRGAVLMYSGLSLATGVTSEKTEEDAFHKITGAEFNSGFGATIAIVPAVDEESSPRLLVGAPMTSSTGTQAGAVYGLDGPWDPGVMSTALGAKVLHGESVEHLGTSIVVGDVGLDGTIDILIGAPGSDTVYGLSVADWFLD